LEYGGKVSSAVHQIEHTSSPARVVLKRGGAIASVCQRAEHALSDRQGTSSTSPIVRLSLVTCVPHRSTGPREAPGRALPRSTRATLSTTRLTTVAGPDVVAKHETASSSSCCAAVGSPTTRMPPMLSVVVWPSTVVAGCEYRDRGGECGWIPVRWVGIHAA